MYIMYELMNGIVFGVNYVLNTKYRERGDTCP